MNYTHAAFAASALAALTLFGTPILRAQATVDSDPQIALRFSSFDPLLATPEVPPQFAAGADDSLWIVQFAGKPTEAARRELRELGAEVHGYLPHSAHVVRMPGALRERVAAQPGIRWVGAYHPAYRLEPQLLAEQLAGIAVPERRYNVVLVDKRTDKPGLIAAVTAIGGKISHEQPGSLLLEVTLSGAQLAQVVRFDEVLWIDRWTAPEIDMDNARVQGGGNYVETVGGYTGTGVRGHIYEGIEQGHVDFTNTPLAVQAAATAQDHGHATAGIVFGNGTSAPQARGMAPDITPFYTNYSAVNTGVSRWQVVQELVNVHQVMFTTASWGGTRTFFYTSESADSDDIVFDHGMVWSQSQSNAGNQDSRPQAWAKNLLSVGGVRHGNNSNPADDSWSGGGSTGPAADGRIKPDLCAYYDSTWTSDRTGAAGYSAGDSYQSFSGTSGATPIVAGHNALAIQMYTDGLFGPLRVPGGTRFQNRPNFTTLKALQIVSATPYAFSAASTDNRREHQGWGFPNLRAMYDDRNLVHVVDETDALEQGSATRHLIQVAPGRSNLKVAMTFADPAANPAAALTRVNDLTLRVISPSGTVYWGNHGLEDGNVSLIGGAPNAIDTVECVFVESPMAGVWQVDVIADLVVVDTHLATTTVDADYGLVVRGGVFTGIGQPGVARSFGTSCPGSVVAGDAVCDSLNANNGFSSVNMRANVGYAFEFTASQAMTVTGFEIYASASSAQTLSAGLMLPNTGGAPGATVSTGTLSIGASAGWSRATVQPFSVSAGQRYFLYFLTNASAPAVFDASTGGTDVGYFRFENGAWGARVSGRFEWAMRVLCPGANASPELRASGSPNLGQNYAITIQDALPSATAGVLVGFSDQFVTAGGAALPIGLAPIGGGTCALFVSSEGGSIAGATNALGNFTAPFSVPSSSGLTGLQVFHQGVVFDTAANQLGLVLTNAIEITIGD